MGYLKVSFARFRMLGRIEFIVTPMSPGFRIFAIKIENRIMDFS